VDETRLKETYSGRRYTIKHCVGAVESFSKAVERLPAGQQRKFKRWTELQIQRLADGERMSHDSFPSEGDLPAVPGKPRRKFRAFKRIPVRGYCWKSDRCPNVYFISHYIVKKKNKLAITDIEKVGNNWTRVEVNEHEC